MTLGYVPGMAAPAELLDFSGRTVVVAGAGGGGIGNSVSTFLAGAGARVIGASTTADALEEFSDRNAGGPGREHPALVADLRKPRDVDRAIAAAGDSLYGGWCTRPAGCGCRSGRA